MNEVSEYLHCGRPGCGATHPIALWLPPPEEAEWKRVEHTDGDVCWYCPRCAQAATADADRWELGATLDELAEAQGVKPVLDIGVLLGKWPGDVDDGFEEAVDELRHGRKGRAVGEWRDNPYTGRADFTVRDYPQGLIVLTVRYSEGEYGWELWVGADGHSATLGSGALTAETPDAAKAEATARAREWAGWLAERLSGCSDAADKAWARVVEVGA